MPQVSLKITTTEVENFARNLGKLAIAIEEHLQEREKQAVLKAARDVFLQRVDVIDEKVDERVYLAHGGGALILLLNNVYLRHIKGDVSEGPRRDGRSGPVVSRLKGTVPRSFFLKRGRSHGGALYDLGKPIPAQRLGRTANPIRTGGPDLTHRIPNRQTFAQDVLNAISASPAVRRSVREGFRKAFSNV